MVRLGYVVMLAALIIVLYAPAYIRKIRKKGENYLHWYNEKELKNP